jgi:hypothetical protein
MLISNKLIIDSTTVALLQNSTAMELSHMFMGDVMASVTDVTPSNKGFASTDVSVADDTITVTGHGFMTGLLVTLTTTGGLPTGLSTSTNYYVIVVDSATIKLATSQSNAAAGTAINITGAGTGNSTIVVTAVVAGAIKLQKSDEPFKLNGPLPTESSWFDIASPASQSFSGRPH